MTPVMAQAPSSAINEDTYIQQKDSFLEQQYVRLAPQKVLWSCVVFFKWWNDIDYPIGDAWDIKPNTTDPKPGDGVLTWEGPGHLAVILQITETTVTVTEGNFVAGEQTWRVIQRDDPVIRGYVTLADD